MNVANVMDELDCILNGEGEVEDVSHVKIEDPDLVKIIKLNHGDLDTEQDVVIERTQLKHGKITLACDTYQSDTLNDVLDLRIITIGDTRYLSLPKVSEPLAILLPGMSSFPLYTSDFSHAKRSLLQAELPNSVEAQTVKKSGLSRILPQLVKKAAMCESNRHLLNLPGATQRKKHTVKRSASSKRKLAQPLKRSNLSEFKVNVVDKPYPCKKCSKPFESERGLKVHQLMKHNVFQCEHCQERFQNKSDYLIHKKIHQNESSFCCEICGKSLATRKTLQSHKRTHAPREFLCDKCPKMFSGKKTLEVHLRTHKRAEMKKLSGGDKEEDRTCTTCSKLFKTAHAVRVHRRSHGEPTGTANFTCVYCKKGYDTTSGLKSHLAMQHSQGKTFMCEFCGKRFFRKDSMAEHLRTHTGEKPYECKDCKKHFNTKNYLTEHERIHTGEKPYKCDLCGRAFRLYTTMKRHKKTHTGEKPFMCDYCSKKFARRCYLNVHLRLHTRNNPFKCEYCEKGYPQKVQLKLHMNSQHPGKSVKL